MERHAVAPNAVALDGLTERLLVPVIVFFVDFTARYGMQEKQSPRGDMGCNRPLPGLPAV